jgi:hypothetical protein
MQLSRHVVSSDDPHNLTIEVVDLPGATNLHHRYDISGFDTNFNDLRYLEPYVDKFYLPPAEKLNILFVNGEQDPHVPTNGVTLESLLAICEHRVQGFEAGQFPCIENDEALHHIGKAIDALHRRTRRVQHARMVKQALIDLEEGRTSLS